MFQTSKFSVLSISYEKADAAIRGKFAFFDDNVKQFVGKIHDKSLGDAFVVSTCNRTEIYCITNNYLLIAEEYCKSIGVQLSEFIQYVNIYQREEALDHLFRVSAGLESQILGDFEIIGQIKKAYSRFKKERKNPNPYMERVINSAIQISKKVKTETSISNGAASVSYAAVHYILNSQKQLSEKNILLLGVGEIGQNTVENLVKHIHKPKVKVMNRTLEFAEKIAEKFDIPHVPYEYFQNELETTDILIVATGANKPIVNQNHIPDGKEMLVIDLSIPNNVEKILGEKHHIELVDVDLLSSKINETIVQRQKEIPKAEAIIKSMTKDFFDWEKKRKMAPKINHFKTVLKKMEAHEMHNIHKKHKYIEVEDMVLSDKIIQKITNRFAKYIIDNPMKAEEVSKLMEEMLVELPAQEFKEKH